MVESLKAGARYLDIGCCIGQDIRQLVADGAPHENLYGAELLVAYSPCFVIHHLCSSGLFSSAHFSPDCLSVVNTETSSADTLGESESQFVDLGYEFFQDRDTLKVHFMQANIFDLGEGSALGPLRGTFDFIHLGMVLHMFDWDRQRVALENCIQLLKPEAGALVLGQAVGDAEGTSAGRLVFRHSDVTFKKLWKEIEEKTGLKFDCRAWVDTGLGIDDGNRGWDLTSARRLAFEVERLAERRA